MGVGITRTVNVSVIGDVGGFGIGMIVVVSPDRVDEIANALRQSGESVSLLGKVIAGAGVTYTGTLA